MVVKIRNQDGLPSVTQVPPQQRPVGLRCRVMAGAFLLLVFSGSLIESAEVF